MRSLIYTPNSQVKTSLYEITEMCQLASQVPPVVVRRGGEEGDGEDEGDGGQAEVEGVRAGLAPGAATLPGLHHHTVTVLQLETEVLGVVLQGLVPAVSGHEMEVLISLVTGEVGPGPGSGVEEVDVLLAYLASGSGTLEKVLARRGPALGARPPATLPGLT